MPVPMTERRDGEAEVREDSRDAVVGVCDDPDCCVGCWCWLVREEALLAEVVEEREDVRVEDVAGGGGEARQEGGDQGGWEGLRGVEEGREG